MNEQEKIKKFLQTLNRLQKNKYQKRFIKAMNSTNDKEYMLGFWESFSIVYEMVKL